MSPEILFGDPRFVVLNKPAGLAAHPGRSGGPSVETWFAQLSRRRDGPWLAHRLDTDTAGCLVVALRKQALLLAQAAFATGRAGKVYWAVLSGDVAGESGTIDMPLRRIDDARGWRMQADASGSAAVSDWRVLGRGEGMTWVEVRPRTGRTHQVRVHCLRLGAPVLGDDRYGGAPRRLEPCRPGMGPAGLARRGSDRPDAGRLHLLARAIHLPLDPPVNALAPPPPHMLRALRRCGFDERLKPGNGAP